MKNKKALIAILAVAIFAAIGGTFAYFRYSQTFSNQFRLGAQEVKYVETFNSPSSWTPCTETPKTLVITNNSTSAINARVKITESWTKTEGNGSLPLKVNNQNMAVINFQNTSDWTLKSDGYYYYKNAINSKSSSNSFIKSVTFNCNAESDYSSARYQLSLHVETIESSAEARAREGWQL
ncbi:MAG: BsaA family SipW-dependent biofilm matrix protein [Candidatus Saccharibacteria bacterium]|nr:BsaA family SipW-dependent biofilm matrix protein [Candidatus Saccharibacteria bacterium]